MSILRVMSGWFRYGGNALGENPGAQGGTPTSNLLPDARPMAVDSALQISGVWSAVSLIAKTIATLPIMVYRNRDEGAREMARDTLLWELLHESPNPRMTPSEFWTALILNLLLRGNAYARIVRARNGEALALWPMAADQVEMEISESGRAIYFYRIGNDVAAFDESSVLHLKEMGNGTVGLSRLEYMAATTAEAGHAQAAAHRLFANGGKPTGVFMVDKRLVKGQRETLMERFAEMAYGNMSRLFILEADMKYQQINLTPQDMQLLSTRQFTIQEIGRWFGVPSILMNQTEGTTTLGSSAGEIIESFYKLNVRHALVAIEQAIRKRVMTHDQRQLFTAEYNLDALLRASLKDRMQIYATATQNGLKTRNECRQLENDEPLDGGDMLTAQSNLVPLSLLGKVRASSGSAETIAQ